MARLTSFRLSLRPVRPTANGASFCRLPPHPPRRSADALRCSRPPCRPSAARGGRGGTCRTPRRGRTGGGQADGAAGGRRATPPAPRSLPTAERRRKQETPARRNAPRSTADGRQEKVGDEPRTRRQEKERKPPARRRTPARVQRYAPGGKQLRPRGYKRTAAGVRNAGLTGRVQPSGRRRGGRSGTTEAADGKWPPAAEHTVMPPLGSRRVQSCAPPGRARFFTHHDGRRSQSICPTVCDDSGRKPMQSDGRIAPLRRRAAAAAKEAKVASFPYPDACPKTGETRQDERKGTRRAAGGKKGQSPCGQRPRESK